MAQSIINTAVKSPQANSYITAAEAVTYLTMKRAGGSGFSALPQIPDQEAFCMWATRLIDTCFEFVGGIRTVDQSLRWPRAGAKTPDGYWIDYDTVPQVVKDATAELAFYLSQRDRTQEAGLLGMGLSHVKVGPIDVTISKVDALPLIPPYVAAMLQWVGSVTGPDEGGGNITLVRS